MSSALIVHSDGYFISVVGQILRSLGVTFTVAGSCEDALRQIKARKPKLIVMDLDKEGEACAYDLAADLKDACKRREVKVVAVSARNRINLTRFTAAGLDGFLMSPLDPLGCRMIIEDVLAREEGFATRGHG